MEKKTGSITLKVYQAILEDITRGHYSLSDYLTEKELMERHGASRAPIREALIQLQSDRFIRSIPRHGYRIDKPSEEEYMDIVAFRIKLECAFFRSFHRMISNEKIRQLRRVCDQYSSEEKKDYIGLWKSNTAFHCELFASYDNDYALRVLKEAMSRQFLNYVEVAKETFPEADLHYAFLDYLEKGNIQTAATLLEADIGKIVTIG
ncbi:MAG: GntR family transcriptional regulator [Lachnospiraceae bacterium]|nr:GntR family transcriptional regulator [Lachnospiraceae bacterium]